MHHEIDALWGSWRSWGDDSVSKVSVKQTGGPALISRSYIKSWVQQYTSDPNTREVKTGDWRLETGYWMAAAHLVISFVGGRAFSPCDTDAQAPRLPHDREC